MWEMMYLPHGNLFGRNISQIMAKGCWRPNHEPENNQCHITIAIIPVIHSLSNRFTIVVPRLSDSETWPRACCRAEPSPSQQYWWDCWRSGQEVARAQAAPGSCPPKSGSQWWWNYEIARFRPAPGCAQTSPPPGRNTPCSWTPQANSKSAPWYRRSRTRETDRVGFESRWNNTVNEPHNNIRILDRWTRTNITCWFESGCASGAKN